MEKSGTLDSLRPGQQAEITRLDAPQGERSRLMALGFVPGAPVRVLLESPWGDPVAYRICGAVIALRRADARQIGIKEL